MPMTSMPQLRYRFDSALVENWGPSILRYVPPRFTLHAGAAAGLLDESRRLLADGIAQRDVRYKTVAEERVHAMPRAIDKLVGNHEIQWLVLFLQRSYRRERQNALDAELLEAMNIGAIGKFGRHQPMPAPMAREKCNLAAVECAQYVGIRRRAERRVQRQLLHIGQAGHGVQSTPTDNSYLCLQRITSEDGVQIIDYTK